MCKIDAVLGTVLAKVIAGRVRQRGAAHTVPNAGSDYGSRGEISAACDASVSVVRCQIGCDGGHV